MKNVVLIIQGKSGVGKSTLIKQVKDRLCKMPNCKVLKDDFSGNKFDIQTILQIGDVKVGIESEGDPGSNLYKRLAELVKQDCNIIICSCRTYGETVNSIGKACYNYEKTWIKHFSIDSDFEEKSLRKSANELSTKFIYDILNSRF